MTKRLEIYKCGVCGNMVEVVHAAQGQLVCCGKPMTLLTENTTDAAKEKHVPVVARTESGVKVAVGSVAHPMEEKHYIEWIEIMFGDRAGRIFLKPGQQPVAVFEGIGKNEVVTAREYCNIHGLWKA